MIHTVAAFLSILRGAAAFTALDAELDEHGFPVMENDRSCPLGYNPTSRGTPGIGGGARSEVLRSQEECAAICESRAGCSRFDFNSDARAQDFQTCFTYTDDSGPFEETQLSPGWIICQKDVKTPPCPTGYASSKFKAGGVGKMAESGSVGLEECSRLCEGKSGCMTFEHNDETQECVTYDDGAANLLAQEQAPNWTTCRVSNPVRNILAWFNVFRKHDVSASQLEARDDWMTPPSETP